MDKEEISEVNDSELDQLLKKGAKQEQ